MRVEHEINIYSFSKDYTNQSRTTSCIWLRKLLLYKRDQLRPHCLKKRYLKHSLSWFSVKSIWRWCVLYVFIYYRTEQFKRHMNADQEQTESLFTWIVKESNEEKKVCFICNGCLGVYVPPCPIRVCFRNKEKIISSSPAKVGKNMLHLMQTLEEIRILFCNDQQWIL